MDSSTLKLSQLRHSLVPFNVSKNPLRSVLWRNKTCELESSVFGSDDFFVDAFSYASGCASENTALAYAERYGGNALEFNGGGARCGNLNDYQVKGIGQNPLAGSKTRTWYKYGQLNIIDAVYEAIYEGVVSAALPNKSAKIYGILVGNNDSAYIDFDDGDESKTITTRSALLIREPLIRPAHFLRSPNYSTSDCRAANIVSDVARVRAVNRDLLRVLGGLEDYLKYILRFTDNIAKQFAVAKMLRLTHGSLTASNISMDGGWLDLTNSSFLMTGQNVGIVATFYQESSYIEGVLKELVYTFSKYNRLNLNWVPILDRYRNCVDHYSLIGVLGFLGCDMEYFEGCTCLDDLKVLGDVITKVLHKNSRITFDWPQNIDYEDDSIVLLNICYALLAGKINFSPEENYFLTMYGIKISEIRSSLENIYSDYHLWVLKRLNRPAKIEWIVARSFVKAFRRMVISAYFYKARLMRIIQEMALSDEIEKFSRFINCSREISQWAFEEDSNYSEALLYTDGRSYLFLCEDSFELTVRNGSHERKYPMSIEGCSFLSTRSFETLIFDFDFRTYIDQAVARVSTGLNEW